MSNHELSLISPFPEAELPCLWTWLEPYKEKVLHDDSPQTLRDFVDERSKRLERVTSWAIMRENEFGGYIEVEPIPIGFDEAPGWMCYLEAFFKKGFWGKQKTLPLFDQVLEALFSEDALLVLFRPFKHNKAVRTLMRELGAREIDDVDYGETLNGIGVTRTIFGLGEKTWNLGRQQREIDFQRVA